MLPRTGAVDGLAGLVQPWATAYPDHRWLQTTLLFTHLAGIFLGGGFAIATDRDTFIAMRSARLSGQIRHLGRIHTIHKPVMFGLVLALASGFLLVFREAVAQSAADTLPEKVVDQAYEAFNRADAAGYYSFFAPVSYHTTMEDTDRAPRRLDRDEAIRHLSQALADMKAFKPKAKAARRIVLGAYVVDEQVISGPGMVHLDIFEVRNGKIVHEWESNVQREIR
jgi:hypothetical protein